MYEKKKKTLTVTAGLCTKAKAQALEEEMVRQRQEVAVASSLSSVVIHVSGMTMPRPEFSCYVYLRTTSRIVRMQNVYIS